MTKDKIVDPLIGKLFKESFFFPYSSATTFYDLKGIKVPEKFGSNCYVQSKWLKKNLEVAGIKTYHVEDELNGRHRALIHKAGDFFVFLDPYLLHLEPIILDSKVQKEHLSHPLSGFYKSKIEISFNGRVLEVTKMWSGLKRKEDFRFYLDKIITEEMSMEKYLECALHPEQKNLSIRVLDPSSFELMSYIFDFTNDSFSAISGAGKSYEGEKEFNFIIMRIAELIGSDINEMKEFLLEGSNIRNEMLTGDL